MERDPGLGAWQDFLKALLSAGEEQKLQPLCLQQVCPLRCVSCPFSPAPPIF